MFQLGGKEDFCAGYAGLDTKVENSSTAFVLVLIPLCRVLVVVFLYEIMESRKKER
jgi:hypothetical protein